MRLNLSGSSTLDLEEDVDRGESAGHFHCNVTRAFCVEYVFRSRRIKQYVASSSSSADEAWTLINELVDQVILFFLMFGSCNIRLVSYQSTRIVIQKVTFNGWRDRTLEEVLTWHSQRKRKKEKERQDKKSKATTV